MQYVKKVTSWGNAIGVSIPAEVRDFCDISVGDILLIEIVARKDYNGKVHSYDTEDSPQEDY